ncbi:MAG TPA: malto-oligosyltrehalose synthase, partial [Verrucomicrobiae bacterium]
EHNFKKMAARLREEGLGLLLDMVPNHMAADLSNAWWRDVLEKGVHSCFANYFDINWQPLDPLMKNKVLLPVLGDYFGNVLFRGELKLGFENGWFFIDYYSHHFPLAPESYPALLSSIFNNIPAGSRGDKDVWQLEKMLNGAIHWEKNTAVATNQTEQLQQSFARLSANSAAIQSGLKEFLCEINGTSGVGESFQNLNALLREQHYRLAYWKVAPEEITYRRFFDVAGLVCLRMERPEVFEAVHEYLFQLLQEGFVNGLRIDHPDGLYNPAEYFRRLQQGSGSAIYVVAEKILTGEEVLPEDWAVDGTTGYDYLWRVNGLFVNSANEKAFDFVYQEFSGEKEPFTDIVARSKRSILERSFYSEWNWLAHNLGQIARAHPETQDLSLRQIWRAIGEIIVAFPIYRTYATEEERLWTESERAVIEEACTTAKKRAPEVEEVVWKFLRQLLFLEIPKDWAGEACDECRRLVLKLQQLTGPVMAKGLEDTAFYNYNRLVSLNEVGGMPERFGVSVAEFHQHNRRIAQRWPNTLLATATHDTKRGEDLRARLNVLSEMPEEWRNEVFAWREMNADMKELVQGEAAPHANDEYLFYQTLVGAWNPQANPAEVLPEFRERIAAYMEKALREAKERTSWMEPNADYEAAVKRFLERVVERGNGEFLKRFITFQKRVAYFGVFNSLGQTLLKMASPGVPDFYQGTELWDLNLVDPDNRRPVDYQTRRALLEDIKQRLAERMASTVAAELLATWESGAVKMYLMRQVLRYRQSARELFRDGEYLPLEVSGAGAENVCAFMRRRGEACCIVVAPRLVYTLCKGQERPPVGAPIWEDTSVAVPELLGERTWLNVITEERITAQPQGGGGHLALADMLASFPVALLAPA